MGFLDKAKGFFGGKNAADVHVECEAFGIGGGINVLEGEMTIQAQRACTLLGTKHEAVLYLERGEDKAIRLLGAESFPKREVSAGQLSMPCELAEGQSVQHRWYVGGFEIDECLRGLGYASPLDALGDASLRIEVRAVADIKGSPFDPSSTLELELERSPFAPK